MLHFVKGDIFESPARVLVNPVNCVGVMGKGLALEFKKRYPTEFNVYKDLCQNEEIEPGDCIILTNEDTAAADQKLILAAATKGHWKNKTELEYVEQILDNIQIVGILTPGRLRSIAIPKLGCGCGGLDWETQVRPLVVEYLSSKDIRMDIYVYE